MFNKGNIILPKNDYCLWYQKVIFYFSFYLQISLFNFFTCVRFAQTAQECSYRKTFYQVFWKNLLREQNGWKLETQTKKTPWWVPPLARSRQRRPWVTSNRPGKRCVYVCVCVCMCASQCVCEIIHGLHKRGIITILLLLLLFLLLLLLFYYYLIQLSVHFY